MARILVFGGSGFAGSAVIRWAIANGHSVRAVLRDPSKAPPGVDVWPGDVLEPASLAGCAERIDAATYSVVVRSQDPAQMVPLHLAAVGNVLDVCDGHVQGFALASGTSVYEFDDGGWYDETAERNATGPIGRLNIASEDLLFERVRRTGFPGCVVRITGVYGPGRMQAAALRDGSLRLPGDGSNYTNTIHVDDAGQALARAAINGTPGEAYIAVDDSGATLGEVMAERAAAAGGAVAWYPIPDDLAQLSLFERMTLSLARSVRFRNDKARRDLGLDLAYPTFRSGTAAAIEKELAG